MFKYFVLFLLVAIGIVYFGYIKIDISEYKCSGEHTYSESSSLNETTTVFLRFEKYSWIQRFIGDHRMRADGKRRKDGIVWIEPTSTSMLISYYDILNNDRLISFFKPGSLGIDELPSVVGSFFVLSGRLSMSTGGEGLFESSSRYRGTCTVVE